MVLQINLLLEVLHFAADWWMQNSNSVWKESEPVDGLAFLSEMDLDK